MRRLGCLSDRRQALWRVVDWTTVRDRRCMLDLGYLARGRAESGIFRLCRTKIVAYLPVISGIRRGDELPKLRLEEWTSGRHPLDGSRREAGRYLVRTNPIRILTLDCASVAAGAASRRTGRGPAVPDATIR